MEAGIGKFWESAEQTLDNRELQRIMASTVEYG